MIWWGTFFPLISEAVTGRRHTFGPPMFDRLTVPLALVLVLLSGIGPLIAWRRATTANLRRNFVAPIAVAAAVFVVALTMGAGRQPDALIMFTLAGFVIGGVTQELVRGVRARRVMAREPMPVALVSLVRRNRRRYGGYLVHVGMAVLFVGIAASSSFAHERDIELRAGQTHQGRRLHDRLREADRRAGRRAERAPRADRPRRPAADRRGSEQPRMHPHREVLLPVDRADARAGLALLRGRVDERGRPAGRAAARLLGRRWRRTRGRLDPRVKEGDRVFAKADKAGALTATQRNEFLGEALRGLTRSYANDPPPATFRVLVSPMVTWIWLGALVVFCGGLIALWPSPRAVGRRVTAAYAARVGREARVPV